MPWDGPGLVSGSLPTFGPRLFGHHAPRVVNTAAGRVLFSEGNSLGTALFALLVAFVILFGLPMGGG